MLFLIGVLILFLVFGMPVVFSIGLTTLLFCLKEGIVLLAIPQRMVAGLDSFPLLAVPFFILAGNLMNTGGITKRLFRFATAVVGFIPGGLGHANVVISMIFAGMSGSAVADAGGPGAVEIKAMKDQGYDPDFSAAVTAASATIGPIIPPSIPMVIYASVADVSVGRLFLAGCIPGLLMGISMIVLVYILAIKRHYPVYQRLNFREIVLSLKDTIHAILMPVVIIAGIVSGIFTPTEAAIIASAYSFVIGAFIYKEISVKDLIDTIFESAKTTGLVMAIFSVANVYGWLLAREQVPQTVASLLFSLSNNPYVLILIIMAFLLAVGCFMEGAAAIIILVPVFLPIIPELGLDPVHFGFIFVFTLMLGLVTPPVGLVLYVVASIANISFERAAKATVPFLIPMAIILLLFAYIPEITMFLPNLLMP